QVLALSVEAEVPQVRRGVAHPGWGEDLAEPVVGEDVAAAIDELAGREVAVLRDHVVEVDLRAPGAGVMSKDDPDGTVAVLDQERVRTRAEREAGVEPRDVVPVLLEDEPEVRVVRVHLEHLVRRLVVPMPQQPPEEYDVDDREYC